MDVCSCLFIDFKRREEDAQSYVNISEILGDRNPNNNKASSFGQPKNCDNFGCVMGLEMSDKFEGAPPPPEMGTIANLGGTDSLTFHVLGIVPGVS